MKDAARFTIVATVSAAAIAFSLYTMFVPTIEASHESAYSGIKREFWLFNSGIPGFNETMVGMPHDVYSMPAMIVRQGDTVVIHFFNLEPQGGDHHSFTILEKPYSMNVELAPGENRTVEFIANAPGTFSYFCTFHQPTMRGELVVQPQ